MDAPSYEKPTAAPRNLGNSHMRSGTGPLSVCWPNLTPAAQLGIVLGRRRKAS